MCFWLLLAPIFYAFADGKNQTPSGEGAPAVEHVPIAPINRTWEIVKTCVHVAAALISIAGVGISAYMMNVYFQDPADASIVGIIGLPVLTLTFLWNALEILIRIRSHWMTGMRPAAHLAMGLIIFIIAIWMGSGLVRDTSRMASSCDVFGDGDLESCDDSDPLRPHINPNMPPCVAAFVIINAAFHLFIFVAGCVDLHRRNKVNRKLDADAAAAAAAQSQVTGGKGTEMEAAQTGVTAAGPALQAPMAAGSVYSLQEYYAPPHAEHSAV